jgi:hypothetical protein
MMSRIRMSLLLAGLACASLAGCSNGSAATAPLTAEQLAERDKQVENEERAHFAQERGGAAAPSQGQ